MTDARNPYAAPTTRVSDPNERFSSDEGEAFIPDGRSVSPGSGAGWLGAAWRMFLARPGKWILNLVLIFVISFVASLIPILGNLFSIFVWPFLSAAIFWAADQQRRTGTFEVNTLFDSIRAYSTSLLVIGAVFLVTLIVFIFVLLAVFGTALVSGVLQQSGNAALAAQMLSSLGWMFLIYAVIVLPVAAATYSAPGLIVLHRLSAGTAMKMSLNASIKNILPGIVFAICAFLLLIVSIIPAGLGLFVSLPVLMISAYTTYRSIFVESRAG